MDRRNQPLWPDPKFLPVRLFLAVLVAVVTWRMMSIGGSMGGVVDVATGALIIVALLVWRPSKARSHRFCLKCSYDLRGIPPDVPCPECGCPRTGP